MHRALPVALVVLLLAGCRAELTLDVSVAADGAGTVTVTLGADAALLAEADAAGADPLGDLAEAGRDLAADGWVVSEAALPDGGREVVLVATFDDPEDFNALAAALADGLAAPEVRLVERLVLRADDRTLRLEGQVGAEPRPAIAELGLEPAEVVELLERHDVFVFEVTATLPGEVVATSADDVEPPLRWHVPPGARVDILAVAERPWPWWRTLDAGASAGLVVGTAVLLAVAVLLVRRSLRRAR